MKLVYTDEALRDLDEILTFIASRYPTVSAAFERRLAVVLRRVGSWPESAQEIEQRPSVRVVPLIRYPYKVFYRVADEAVEILHIHHAARQDPWDDPR
jgi:plasmid stabilization system protein ParE